MVLLPRHRPFLENESAIAAIIEALANQPDNCNRVSFQIVRRSLDITDELWELP
jgi:hypothetical protein